MKRLYPTLNGLVALTLVWPALAAPPAATSAVTHMTSVRQANRVLEQWEADQAQFLSTFLPQRGLPGGPNEDFDIRVDSAKVKMQNRTEAEQRRDDRTHELVEQYDGAQGINRYTGAFLESGAAWTGSYQWDTQRSMGFDVKADRDKLLDRVASAGIRNIRLGINIHELDLKNPATLAKVIDFHQEAWKRGISLTDSVLFFSGLRIMETRGADGKVDPTRSYENNPAFPAYVEQVADFVLSQIFKAQAEFNTANSKLPLAQRQPVAHTAINPVNEPETLAGFNNFWNGGYANWGDPNVMRLYVPTIISIARANVRIRVAAERAAKKFLGGARVLFFHNEAMTPPDYPSHQGDLQFAVSKFMLGDDQLMMADFARLAKEPLASMRARFATIKAQGRSSVVEAAILKYAGIPANDTPAKQETARRKVISWLQTLRNEHLAYQKMSGKTAKTDTIVMLDYYEQSEFILPKPVPQMVQDLAANQGELLKRDLLADDDRGFMTVLEQRVHQAEQAVGQKLWPDGATRANLDFEKLLGEEDAIVLDKVMGLRNDWTLNQNQPFVDRRNAAGFNMDDVTKTDEKRIDGFFNSILADDAKLLKAALRVTSDEQLIALLQSQGANLPNGLASLRDAFNADERSLLHSLFGLQRARDIGFLPPHYARQVRAGMRKGFYKIFLKYIDELGIRIGGMGESGTPYYPWASLVHKQMLISLVGAARATDFYFVRYDLGPAVGVIGWMSGPMTGDLQTNGKRGEDGIFKMVQNGDSSTADYQLSAWPGSQPWYLQFRADLDGGLTQAAKENTR